MLRERYLRGDFEIIDGEVWMRDLKESVGINL